MDTLTVMTDLPPQVCVRPVFLDLLACALCKAPLDWQQGALRCARCAKDYRLLPESGVPVLLPDETFANEHAESARDMKMHVVERFAMVHETLPEPYRAFATFLNLGYVANENQQHAVRGPAHAIFNQLSTKLLFEVLGSCDLDGRVTLELGAGRGGNIAMIQRYYNPKMLVGLDLSPVNAEFCRRHHTVAGGGFIVGDVEYLPFRDAAADVVLNLESSHYYPNINRFFDEVYRVLAPGGEFLYADILPAETFASAVTYLDHLGFDLTRNQDISSNVLLSCAAIAKLRERAQGNGVYNTFLVVPGSAEFEALCTGHTQYRILTLRKP